MKHFLLAALTVFGLAFANAAKSANEKLGAVVLTSTDGKWEVRSLGKDVYVFRWNPDFYQSLFVVSPRETLVVDPFGHVAAPYYRDAIKRITSAPVTMIVYSHSHADHIAGATELAPNAQIIAHAKTRNRLIARGDKNNHRVCTYCKQFQLD